MINKKMTFICAQPDVPYFHWQVEVLIHNLMKSGVNPNCPKGFKVKSK